MNEDSLETLVRIYFDWQLTMEAAINVDEMMEARMEMVKYEAELKQRTNWYRSRGKES